MIDCMAGWWCKGYNKWQTAVQPAYGNVMVCGRKGLVGKFFPPPLWWLGWYENHYPR